MIEGKDLSAEGYRAFALRIYMYRYIYEEITQNIFALFLLVYIMYISLDIRSVAYRYALIDIILGGLVRFVLIQKKD